MPHVHTAVVIGVAPRNQSGLGAFDGSSRFGSGIKAGPNRDRRVAERSGEDVEREAGNWPRKWGSCSRAPRECSRAVAHQKLPPERIEPSARLAPRLKATGSVESA